jgi:hypothetical protein
MNAYITNELLSIINSDVVGDFTKGLKTAKNKVDIMVQSGTSAIEIPAIYPETSADSIEIPLFGTSAVTQYSYEKIDVYKDSNDSNTLDYPEPNTMTLKDELGGNINVLNISTNECMIYAMACSIIKKLLNDNKLIINDNDPVQPFKWKLQEESYAIDFIYTQLEIIQSIVINDSVNVDKINFVNVMIKEETETKWKNAIEFNIDTDLKKINITVDNDYSYLDPALENKRKTIMFKIFYCYS